MQEGKSPRRIGPWFTWPSFLNCGPKGSNLKQKRWKTFENSVQHQFSKKLCGIFDSNYSKAFQDSKVPNRKKTVLETNKKVSTPTHFTSPTKVSWKSELKKRHRIFKLFEKPSEKLFIHSLWKLRGPAWKSLLSGLWSVKAQDGSFDRGPFMVYYAQILVLLDMNLNGLCLCVFW